MVTMRPRKDLIRMVTTPNVSLVVTQGPYSTFMEWVTTQSIVSGLRLNTIMPIKNGMYKERLQHMKSITDKYDKDLWIDLKGRQLRTTSFTNTPYTVAEISCPTKYFAEASSINLPRSVKYGFGCLKTAVSFRLAKMKLMASALFPSV